MDNVQKKVYDNKRCMCDSEFNVIESKLKHILLASNKINLVILGIGILLENDTQTGQVKSGRILILYENPDLARPVCRK